MNSKTPILLLLLLLASITSAAQKTDRIDLAVRRACLNPALRHASFSIAVRSIQHDSTIYDFNADHALLPAGLNKLFTSAAAYSRLGSDFCFSTSIEHSGYIDTVRKTLHGNLYICGTGDPLFGSPAYKQTIPDSVFIYIAGFLKHAKIFRISGHIYADGSCYSDETVHPTWQWGDIGNYFCAGAGGINYFSNAVEVHFAAGKNPGEPARIIQQYPNIPIVNNVTTGPADTAGRITFFGTPNELRRVCYGVIPQNVSDTVVRASLPLPDLVMAQELTQWLRQSGVPVNGEAGRIARRDIKEPTKALPNSYYNSAPLNTIFSRTIFSNSNTVAESLFKHLGFRQLNDGSYAGGQRALRLYFEELGLDASCINLVDGCGLSRDNHVTANFICNFLDTLATESYFQEMYDHWEIDYSAKDDASLRIHLPNKCALKYKTGTMTGVRNIAGYATNRKGETYAFAILCNNYDCEIGTLNTLIGSIIEEIVRL